MRPTGLMTPPSNGLKRKRLFLPRNEAGQECSGAAAPGKIRRSRRTESRCSSPDTQNQMTKRSRGRPPGRTQDRPFQMRVSETFLRTVDDWRRGQIDLPSRAEAIRRMVELAAKMKKRSDSDR